MRALHEPGEPQAEQWLRAIIDGRVRAHVPDLVYLEVANALVRYVDVGEMTSEEAVQDLDYLLEVPLESVPGNRLAKQALALGITRRLSTYDASYLALSLGMDAVLVTADRRLAGHAERSALLPDEGPPD